MAKIRKLSKNADLLRIRQLLAEDYHLETTPDELAMMILLRVDGDVNKAILLCAAALIKPEVWTALKDWVVKHWKP